MAKNSIASAGNFVSKETGWIALYHTLSVLLAGLNRRATQERRQTSLQRILSAR
jgi:hypothetical protein